MGKNYSMCCQKQKIDLYACDSFDSSPMTQAGTPDIWGAKKTKKSKTMKTILCWERRDRTSRSTIPDSLSKMSEFEEKSISKFFKMGKILSVSDHWIVREGYHVNFPDEKVAIKIIDWWNIRKDEQSTFERIQALELSNHPNITNLLKIFMDDDHLYIVTEYVKGIKLEDYIIKKGEISEECASAIIHQILWAVNYLHTNGIKHKNIAIRNILVDPDTLETKVINFGLASHFCVKDKSTSLNITPKSSIIGNDKYPFIDELYDIGYIATLLCSEQKRSEHMADFIDRAMASPLSDRKLSFGQALSHRFLSSRLKTRLSLKVKDSYHYGLSRISSIMSSVSISGSSFFEF
jgi:hypothetical protein